jgi:hypothetical protein
MTSIEAATVDVKGEQRPPSAVRHDAGLIACETTRTFSIVKGCLVKVPHRGAR